MGKLRCLFLLCVFFSSDLLSHNQSPIIYFKCAPGDVNQCQFIYRDGYSVETTIHDCMSKNTCAINIDTCLDYKANNVYYKVLEQGKEKLYQYNFLTFTRSRISVLNDDLCSARWRLFYFD